MVHFAAFLSIFSSTFAAISTGSCLANPREWSNDFSPSKGKGGYKPAEVETARPGCAHSFSECTF